MANGHGVIHEEKLTLRLRVFAHILSIYLQLVFMNMNLQVSVKH